MPVSCSFFPVLSHTPASALATFPGILARMKWIVVQVIKYKWNITIYVYYELSRLKTKYSFLIKLELETNIYESTKNGCIGQQYQTFASYSEQLCTTKARRCKQNQQVERLFNFIWRNFTSKRFIRRRRSVLNLCYVAFPEDDITWCFDLVNRKMVPL